MATLRNKRSLAAFSRETPEYTRKSQSQNTVDPGMAQEYISHVSEEIERRVNKKFSTEFSRTESGVLGALSKLDENLLNPQVRTCSVAVPEISRNNGSENRAPTGDCSLGDPCHEAVFSTYHSSNLNDSQQEETHHMVTGVQEEIRHRPLMVTRFEKEIPYYFLGTSSGKEKKVRFTSQLQFRSENTPAINEADQILLALQQLASNTNSANFNNNVYRISKLPKSFTRTMPTFDGKSEKFELLENPFQTSLKIHNQLTEEDKMNFFHSVMRGDALQTFKNITSLNSFNGENLGEILSVFRGKYVKLQSMATAKHKIHRLVFNQVNHKVIDFLEEL